MLLFHAAKIRVYFRFLRIILLYSRKVVFLQRFLIGLFFLSGGDALHDDGAGGVAGDGHDGAAHVDDAVDTGGDGHALDRDAGGGEDHGHQCQAAARDAGCAYGGHSGSESDGHILAEGEVDAAAGSHKDRSHAEIDGDAVHVDGGAQGEHEASHILADAHLLGALHRVGEGGHGGVAGEGEHHGGLHVLEELQRRFLPQESHG